MSDTFWQIVSAVLMITGVTAMLLGIFGVYRFRYVLNRMHCASILDTLGMLCILLSLAAASRDLAYLPKLLLILLMLWIGSPIASHLVSRMEYRTDPEAEAQFKKEDRT